MIRNKILGKVTKFGGKRTKTLGVANRFMVGGGGAQCAPLGLYRVKEIIIIQFFVRSKFH